MKKYLSFCLLMVTCMMISCTKTGVSESQGNTTQSQPVFVPVTLFGSSGNWGGSICSWGFVMVRQDSSIVYHAVALPPSSNITNTPVNVSILFHDTIQLSSCWREIVVDSIKH